MDNLHRLYLLFSDLLDYPTPALSQKASKCTQLLSVVSPPAADVLLGFQGWVGQESPGRVEEIFTSTFDLQGTCCPYVGHYLFGDNYQRSRFMACLSEGYHNKGFSYGNELPDHVAVILRFLALGSDDEFSQVLLEEGFLPSVEKMVQSFAGDSQNPYGQVLRSLNLLLQAGNLHMEGSLVTSETGGLAND